MSFNFINIAMLAGLASVILPVLAHLLSKRRYDVVQWGAMQFLQLGQRTRRRIRFQDLLLLLLRMALLGCLVLALARPYGQGRVFAKLGKAVSRDVVFVIDGSGSMGWKGDVETPRAAAIQWVHEAIEEMSPGDTVALIDARSRNRRLIHPPTSSMTLVRKTLDQIPEPTGTSNLIEATIDAVRILSTTSNVTREVVLLTDGQAFPWNIEDNFGLQRLDDILKQPEITPSVSVVNLSADQGERSNCSIDRIELSRELTVPGFPIRFRTTIRQSGGVAIQKEVSLAINGQPSPESTRIVNLLPNGEALVEFEHVFPTTGDFRISLSIDADNLPQDDFSEAIVVVEDGIPVLLVDGAPNIDETQAETFFLKSAFASSSTESPWIRTEVIQPSELNEELLTKARVVFLSNVATTPVAQQLDLIDFVLAGGGLVIAPSEMTNAKDWNAFQFDEDNPFLPAEFTQIEEEDPASEEFVTIESLSLEAAWLRSLRKESGVDFWTTRFSKWWELKPIVLADAEPLADEESEEDSGSAKFSSSSVIAKLTNGKPYIVSRRLGDGMIFQFAAPLDADWSTLPARNDFVPFVHELVFRLTGVDAQHNVEVGVPLQIQLKDDERPRDYLVSGPGIDPETPETARDGRKSLATFKETSIPGLYWFAKKNAPNKNRIPFIVTDDRVESDLAPLDKLGWETLTANDRLQRIETMGDLTDRVQSENSRTELWWLLLLLLLLMLVGEVALTRKMVREGHTDLEEKT